MTMPESAFDRAEEALPDRCVFRLDAEQWKKFHAALNARPHELKRLAKPMRAPSVFERSVQA
ncbi:MAG TPA: DUF1778 domain-containing protein [Rhizomicrobium sp.]|nr:DUF1778 domain-containing protein [Rhizomicrobium sp.]